MSTFERVAVRYTTAPEDRDIEGTETWEWIASKQRDQHGKPRQVWRKVAIPTIFIENQIYRYEQRGYECLTWEKFKATEIPSENDIARLQAEGHNTSHQ